jgi:hypothetical protein
MRRTRSGRVLATVFLGVMGGVYLHVREGRWLEAGRDAYMAMQSEHYQRITAYHSLPSMMAAGLVLAGVSVGLYEMIAAGITHVLPASTVEE